MNEWIVYSRPGCGLCDDFIVELTALLGARAAQIRIVDIDTDADLIRKYGDRIPVLAIDGDFVCNYRVDAERVHKHLPDASGSTK